MGAQVFATAGSDEKCRTCESLGATLCVNYKKDDFEAVLKEPGIDVILDMIGGDYTPKNLRLLHAEGRLVMINTMQGNKVEIDLNYIMRQRLTITGSTLRNRESSFKASLAAAVEKNVWPLVASGVFKPVVFTTFPLADAAAAHALMESSDHTGKIVLTV
jgi:NADPH:quinone reductase-like Zn-dependent oxidoreductase